MIDYIQPVFRPPSEANSLILQATLGCSHNGCIFCDMYKEKPFRVRPIEDVLGDVKAMEPYKDRIEKIFIADGDPLCLTNRRLLPILHGIKEGFPAAKRVSIYANTDNILRKSLSDLKELKAAGITLLYLGIESGSDEILGRVNKGATGDQHAEAINKAQEAGIDVSAMIISGLGGKEFSREHMDGTARVVSQASPAYLATLQLMISPEAQELIDKAFPEGFTPLNDLETLQETREMLSLMDVNRSLVFRSNHASNALSLKGNLPEDRQALLDKIDHALAGEAAMRPDWMRGF